MALAQTQQPGGSAVTPCSSHPKARAAWQCSSCRRDLCPACAANDTLGHTVVVRCTHCGAVAEVLMVRRLASPWWNTLPAFFKAIFSLRGLFQLTVIGFLMLVSRFMMLVPLIGWILGLFVYYGVYASYSFLLIGSATSGEEELPPLGTMGREFSDLVGSAFRLFLATAIVWLPLAIYLYRSIGLAGFASREFTFWSDPVVLTIVLAGLIYVPAAFVVAALADSALAALNPLGIIALISRKPAQYAGVALFASALFFGNSFLEQGIVRALGPQCFLSFGKTFVTLWLVRSVTLILPALTALVLGRFIHQNAVEFGVRGAGAGAQEPALPGAKPQGRMPDQPPDKPAQVPVAPPVALELETTPAEALAGSLKLGNDSIALDAYRRLSAAGQAPSLPAESELQLARILDRAGDPLAAAHACRRAAQQDLRGPLAPEALWLAGRLLIERVQAVEDGKTLLRYLVKNYPDTDQARRAQPLLDA